MHDRIGFSFSAALAGVVPFVCAILGAIVANVPISLFGGILPPPLLAFMPVYFWCLVRPDLMPAPAALAIGIVEDLLSGGPMGIWAAGFVAAYVLVDRQRDAFAGLSGIGAILGFGAALLLACTVAFVIVTLSYWRIPPVEPMAAMVAMTVLFYFPGLSLLNLLHHRFVGPLRSEF